MFTAASVIIAKTWNQPSCPVTDRENEQRRGRETEADRESEASSELSAEPNVGLEPTNHEFMTEPKSHM